MGNPLTNLRAQAQGENLHTRLQDLEENNSSRRSIIQETSLNINQTIIMETSREDLVINLKEEEVKEEQEEEEGDQATDHNSQETTLTTTITTTTTTTTTDHHIRTICNLLQQLK